jgi:uncharacterized membrane protein YoaK (UPF0700 family)
MLLHSGASAWIVRAVGIAAARKRVAPKEVTILLWLLIILLIVVIVVFGLGFVVESLFWIALALFIIWIVVLLVNAIRRR